MYDDLLYQIALTMTPHIGPVQAKILALHFENAASVFKAPAGKLQRIEGIGETRAAAIRQFAGFSEAEKEIRFIEQHHIQPLFITHPAYPQRLLHCHDAPALLYYKGKAALNASRIVAVVGTRHNTDYGRYITEMLIRELSAHGVVVVSGLAYGIDAIAHKTALQQGIPTIGVLAHGLDQVYPYRHTALAADMLEQGGLLTEFRGGTKPDRHHFPGRNRIVAGMSDAVIVVETGLKGGSIITAELAGGYNRDVFAVPGKLTDTKSAGCNQLIHQLKAQLLPDTNTFLEQMGWKEQHRPAPRPPLLFADLQPDETCIVNLLKEKESLHIDELLFRCAFSSSRLAAGLLELELKNLVKGLPGKRYRLA